MKPYKVILIGCGHMGQAHMEQLYYRQDVELYAVCDSDPARALLFQRKYGAKFSGVDYREFLPGCDIAVIATYPSSHLKILQDCIAQKVHVLCEKPVAPTLEKAKEFIRLAQHAEIKVLAGYILRHHGAYRRIAQMLRQGAIGSPIIMRMTQNHHTMNWEKYRSLIEESSPIIDCGVHYFDVMRWFTGEEMKSISGIGARTEGDLSPGKYNYGLVTVEMSGGSVAYYEAGWGNTVMAENKKEFIGPKGRLRLVPARDRESHREEGDLIEYYKYPEKTYECINVPACSRPTGEQFEHLLRMIEQNEPPCPAYEDIIKSMEMAWAGDRSICGKSAFSSLKSI